MKKFLGFLFILWAAQAAAENVEKATMVRMQTNLGTIVLQLDAEKAPKSVENFLSYVKEGFYDGTIFHRVIDNFMIQGGGFTPDYTQKKTHASVDNEAKNGLKNLRGTIAMARTSAPHSATAQFFINVKDNAFLDYPGHDGWGYTVFGKVIEGMDVVDKIKGVKTGSGGPFPTDVPQQQVVIEKITLDQPKSE
jgi:cyclophilin family peptidyl-prolyl cis-trans isomerase